MLCETCQLTGRPGFVRSLQQRSDGKEVMSAELAQIIQGCYIFDTFSLDDPVAYPPDENEEWK